ncbi:dienelactone hydrolase family protein [Pandoraea bronchicola]|uniref:Dienelactone hydrolase n=1 Tax=Pandoraea bronchicola TaxID=2508287 RepID=A0A5E5BN65_9BURK|nr:dienelactone hydrolase family protein [Pandoraea bronchicola]VVE86808.1 dienelactone hydrolase [Pandoraea bronchicola]
MSVRFMSLTGRTHRMRRVAFRLARCVFSRLAVALACISSGWSGTAFAQEKVSIPSWDADSSGAPVMIDAYLFRAANASGPTPAVVFMHGCNGMFTRKGKIDSRELDWAQRLNAQGYAVLAVDSFTSRAQPSECAKGGPVRPSVERPRDAYGALRYLQRLPGIRPDRIALMGWSHGGGTVLFSIGPKSPGRVPGTRPGPDFVAAIAFYPGWCNAAAQGAGWSTRIPLLLLTGADDVWTKAAPCDAFVRDVTAQGAPVTFHIYPGAVHDFDYPNLPVRNRPEFTNPRTHVVPITGTQPEARDDAIARVTAFLANAFGT